MLRHAGDYFEEWMDSGDGFYEMYEAALKSGRNKIAAFQLHQVAERYITCLLLVYTGYRPTEHDMEKLIGQAAGFDPRFGLIFPNNTKEEAHLFDLLPRAYVDARYSKSYRITDEELNTIGRRVATIKAIALELYMHKISTLRNAAETIN